MQGGEIFVPKIPSYRITDLATAVNPHCRQEIIGIRPGEKLHEEMITATNSLCAMEFSKHYVIMPEAPFSWSMDRFSKGENEDVGRYVDEGFSYNSETNDHVLTIDELRQLIKDHVHS